MNAAAQALLNSPLDPEMGRDLIDEYNDSAWREKRIEILHALHEYPQPRVIEFLIRTSLNQSDIPMAEAAIWALGKTKSPIAARFLIQFLETCEECIKPVVVVALGGLQFQCAAPSLLRLLPNAINQNAGLLTKNVLLTLAELRVQAVIPYLQQMALQKNDAHLAHSSMLGLGKVSRDSEWFRKNERWGFSDLFRSQIYSTAKDQVNARQLWQLDELLQKVFVRKKKQAKSKVTLLPGITSALMHEIFYELGCFPEETLFAALADFMTIENYSRLCAFFSKCNSQQIATHFPSVFELLVRFQERQKAVSSAKNKALLNRIILDTLNFFSHHIDDSFKQPLLIIRGMFSLEDESLWNIWIETLAVCLPDSLAELESLLHGDEIFLATSGVQISFVNALVNTAIAAQSSPKKMRRTTRILERMLTEFSSQGRVGNLQSALRCVRAFAQLEQQCTVADSFVVQNIQQKECTSTCLFYLSKTRNPRTQEIVVPLFLKETSAGAKIDLTNLKAMLHALTQQEISFSENGSEAVYCAVAELCKQLKSDLQSELLCTALRFAAVFPHALFEPAVKKALSHKVDKVRIFGLLAAKSMGEDSFLDHIVKNLSSGSEVIRGRSLDAMLALPGNGAKIAVVNYLEKSISNAEICEKVIRDFRVKDSPQNYFQLRFQKIIEQNPHHSHVDGFAQIIENIKLSSSSEVKGSAQVISETMISSISQIIAIENHLLSKIVGYNELNAEIKTALRAAETPFFQPEIFNNLVDKSASIIEYAKAIDIMLNEEFGKRHLFPSIERNLAKYQSAIHALGLNHDFPSYNLLMQNAGLGKLFSEDSLPMGKMATMSRYILNGRILFDKTKVFDGLRAWAVAFLLFCRPLKTSSLGQSEPKALLLLNSFDDVQVQFFAKKLIDLQEARNPVAHRKTLVDFAGIDAARNAVYDLFSGWKKFSPNP